MTSQITIQPAENRTGRRETVYLLTHVILVFVAQTIYAYFYHHSTVKPGVFAQITTRLLIWTVPVLVYLAVTGTNPLDYLKVKKNVLKGIAWGTIVGAAIVFFNIIGSYIIKGRISIKLDLGTELWLKAIILVGLSEEVLFRGFILQKIEERRRFRVANLLSAALFLLIHFPGWILQGSFVFPDIARSAAYIFAFGLLEGFALKKTGSLWACMLIHSFNNFASLTTGMF